MKITLLFLTILTSSIVYSQETSNVSNSKKSLKSIPLKKAVMVEKSDDLSPKKKRILKKKASIKLEAIKEDK